MGRRPTGFVEWVPPSPGDPGHWKTRVRFVDGSRPWVHLPPGLTETEAKARSVSLQVTARAGGYVSKPSGVDAEGETFAAYRVRWIADRKRRGLTSVGSDESRLINHVAPTFDPRPMRAITRLEIEQLVEQLDRKAVAGEYMDVRGMRRNFSAKTAENVWSCVRKLFDDACHSKVLDLRVLTVDPTDRVRGPDAGVDKSKVAPFPSESLAVFRAEIVPLAFRRLLAVGAYTYTRAGELFALEWSDIDEEHGRVDVNKALQADGTIGPPKSGKARIVPIEAPLLPLLAQMRRETGGRGRVFPVMPSMGRLAQMTRAAFFAAGVQRAALFADDETRKALGFHDATRSAGITWRAMRGDHVIAIKDDAGHSALATTEGYIRVGEQMRRHGGEPFPALPIEMFGPVIGPPRTRMPRLPVESECRGRDLNPSTRGPNREGAEISAIPATVDVQETAASGTDTRALDRVWTEPPTLLGGLATLVARAIAEGDLDFAERLIAARRDAKLVNPADVVDLRDARARKR